ncbi:hypothetical protein L596_013437 [Steinernema carpocapsae]|uniref:Uncharacterized protein n=1 Tax=Steinernema carpocapsae TaxID=34508 RepID=A0A4U5P0T1_STECR|nr:hypothetical protein L596_013437 [Steinernema carpocapsae]
MAALQKSILTVVISLYAKRSQTAENDSRSRHWRQLISVIIYATLPNLQVLATTLANVFALIISFIPIELRVPSNPVLVTSRIIVNVHRYGSYIRVPILTVSTFVAFASYRRVLFGQIFKDKIMRVTTVASNAYMSQERILAVIINAFMLNVQLVTKMCSFRHVNGEKEACVSKHRRQLLSVVIYATVPNFDLLLDVLFMCTSVGPFEMSNTEDSFNVVYDIMTDIERYKQYVRMPILAISTCAGFSDYRRLILLFIKSGQCK